MTSADAKDEVSLFISGKIYKGWTGVSVKSGIRSIADSFDLTLTDDWTKPKEAWPISPQEACIVKIGTEEIISGYIDDVVPSFDGGQHSVTVSGRSKTGDMVDCSADSGQGKYQKLTLLALAQRLAAPFGISVVDNFKDTFVFPNVNVGPGESSFEVLDKQARLRGCLLYCDSKGNIVLGTPGTQRCVTALVEGQNIFSASAKFSAKDRHSVYRVKSQYGGWSANVPPSVATGIIASAADVGIKRYRPLEIVAETNTDTSGAQRRADWENSTRRGKSQPITISIEGHRQGDGSLWKKNNLVQVKSPWLSLAKATNLLIVEIDYVQNSDGTLTTLQLMPAEGMKVLKKTENPNDLWKNYGVSGGAAQ